MSDHDKARLWSFFPQRILPLQKASTTGKLIHNPAGRRGANRTESNAATSARFSRMKDERSHSKMMSTTCLSRRCSNDDAKNAHLRSLLCASALLQTGKFKPLDDDTFSTKPMIGFASRYNRHFSEIWLADYLKTTKKKAQHCTSKESTNYSENETARETSGCLKKSGSLSSCSLGSSRGGVSSLGQEIDHLSKILKKASIASSRDLQGGVFRGGHHVAEFDVQSITSHTSSLYTSEYSFEADFSQLGERSRSSGRSVHLTGLADLDYTIGPPLSSRMLATNVTTWEAVKHQHMDLFQPVLSESGDNEGGILYKNNVVAAAESTEGRELTVSNDSKAKRSVRAMSHASSQAVPHASSHALYPLSERVTDVALDMFERHIAAAALYVSNTGSDDIPVEEILFSSQESNDVSEVTTDAMSRGEGPVGAVDQRLGKERKIKQLGPRIGGDSGCRKAKCVVVYDKQFNETEQTFYDDVPANVKEMVDRFEILRRLEADHAARFGYKDFLPIQEQ
jgi:hypothetical protein